MRLCANCGSENQDDARFCDQCGTPVEATSGVSGERRQITVVFSDLSGFTAMSEHLDPEDVRAVMSDIFSRATKIIERYSGRVDKLLGDAVMSVFGDPVAHEDDAERAVRATIEIHAMVDELSPDYEARVGRSLQMHSGINTGIVVTSSSNVDTADTGPLGDTINVAARLEDLSQAGEILLGPETAKQVAHVFELADYGAHDLKGKTGLVPVSKVSGIKHARTGPSRRQAAFVGRHEELGILLAAVESVQDGARSVVTIKAEAGTGKSRLLEEFHQRVEDRVQWLEGRAYAYGENIPYAPLVDLISNAIGVGEDDTQNSIAEKLHSGIGSLVDGDNRVLDPFVRLYGLPERSNAALDKDSFQDRLLESLTRVVEALCGAGPTVIVLQDLHWADPSTVTMFEDLIGTITTPVVIIANHRPAFAGLRVEHRSIELGALSPRQTSEMVKSLLDTDAPPPALIEFIVERTDGNPFFVEEMVNSLVETGALVNNGSEWTISGALTDADLPTSVRGVIAARIDRLDTERRQVLREASVVGRQFLYEVIKRVSTATDTLDRSLTGLESADLIRERGHDEDLEYYFKHALTQDVAYEGLLKAERVDLHARAAAAIEAQFAGRLEEVAETLAFHYTQGEVVDKAVHYLRKAGDKAMERYALIESQAHFTKAYELITGAPSDAVDDGALVDLILDWAILFYYQADFVRLRQLLERHQDDVDRLGDETTRMWWLVWKGHAAGAQLDQTDNLRELDEALAIAERIGDQMGIAYAKTWTIWALFMKGDVSGSLSRLSEIDDWVTANRHIDPYPYFKSRLVSVYAACAGGHAEGVEDMCHDAIGFGQEVGNNRCIAVGYQGLAFHNSVLGNFEAAIEFGRRAAATAKDPIYRDTAYLTLSVAGTLTGNNALVLEAGEHLASVTEQGIDLTTPLFAQMAEAARLTTTGRLTEGIETLLKTVEEAEQSSRIWEGIFAEFFLGVIYSRIVTGELTADLKTLVRNPGFLPYLRRARKQAEPRLRAILDKTRRIEFLGAAHLIEVELAKFLLHRGEREEARRLLESALEYVSPFGEGEATARIRQLLANA